MRFGLMTNTRRSWSEIGERAILPHQQSYSNSYLYSAVSPLTGEGFHLFLPEMTSDVMKIFLEELKKQHPNQEVVVVLDNAPCHRRKDIKNIKGLTMINLPSYSPELNPTERYFEEIRRETANRIFESLNDCEERITEAVKKWSDPEKLRNLIGYEWILRQFTEVI